MRKRYLYIALSSVILIIPAIFGIKAYTNHLMKENTVEAAQLWADGNDCLAARYASLMLRAIDLQPSDCFVCSAVGFPPHEAFKTGGEVEPFTDYHMVAYIISGSQISERMVPLSITIPGSESSEEITVEAELVPVSKCFYIAEFLLPRDKIQTHIRTFMYIKCGKGRDYKYSAFVDSDRINPHIFMNDSCIDELQRGAE